MKGALPKAHHFRGRKKGQVRKRNVFKDETLAGIKVCSIGKKKDTIEIDVTGFLLDKEKSKGPLAETKVFKPPQGVSLPPGYTHVARTIKRKTRIESWHIVNSTKRTTDRRSAPRMPKVPRQASTKNQLSVAATNHSFFGTKDDL